MIEQTIFFKRKFCSIRNELKIMNKNAILVYSWEMWNWAKFSQAKIVENIFMIFLQTVFEKVN